MLEPVSPQSAYSSVRQSEELTERPYSPISPLTESSLRTSSLTATTEESDPQYRSAGPDPSLGWPFHRPIQTPLPAVPEESSRQSFHSRKPTRDESRLSGGASARPPTIKRGWWSVLQDHFDDTWTSEILALLLALLCLIIIVLVLRRYDGESIAELPENVGLGAVLAILSTASKSALIYAVSSAIGQSKWDWFVGGIHRSLHDLQKLDGASRGSLGSIRTVFAPTLRSAASVGAIITILALAVDPFVQQVIHYRIEPTSKVLTGNAWARKVSAPTYLVNSSDPTYVSAVNGPVWTNASAYTTEVSCPTGDCSWSTFESLGWCVQSQVVSDLESLRVDCNISQANADYSGGVGIGATSNRKNCTVYFDSSDTNNVSLTYPLVYSYNSGDVEIVPLELIAPMTVGNATVLGVQDPELAMGHFRFALANATDSSSPPDSMNLTWAEQAVMATCVKKYNVSVVQGAVKMQTLSERYGTFYNSSDTVLGANATCWKPDNASSPTSWEERTAAGGARYVTDPDTMAFCSTNWTWGADIRRRLSSVYKADLYTTDPNATEYWSGADWNSSEEVFYQIKARGLSSVVQSMGASLDSLYGAHSSETAPGSYNESSSVTVRLHVRWWWLFLPFALTVVAYLFLGLVMFQSRKTGKLWKGSVLAVLYHGLENNGASQGAQVAQGAQGTQVTQVTQGNVSTVSAMNYAAKHTSVRLVSTGDGDKLVTT